MGKLKPECYICGKCTEGIGTYHFTYLNETVILCGHDAQEVRKSIEQMKDVEEYANRDE